MERGDKYRIFFRLRSAIPLEQTRGWQGREHWLFEAVQFIDINEELLIYEFANYAYAFQGFVSLKEFFGMRWNEYRIFERGIKPLVDKIKREHDASK